MNPSAATTRKNSKALVKQSRELVRRARRAADRARGLVKLARNSIKESASITTAATKPDLSSDHSDPTDRTDFHQ